MELAKAIEILDNHGLKPEGATWGDFLDAVKLGSEALKRLQACRQPEGGSPLPPLAHETAPDEGH